MIQHMKYLEQENSYKKKIDYRYQRSGGGRTEKNVELIRGHRILGWNDSKVLEIDNGVNQSVPPNG